MRQRTLDKAIKELVIQSLINQGIRNNVFYNPTRL